MGILKVIIKVYFSFIISPIIPNLAIKKIVIPIIVGVIANFKPIPRTPADESVAIATIENILNNSSKRHPNPKTKANRLAPLTSSLFFWVLFLMLFISKMIVIIKMIINEFITKGFPFVIVSILYVFKFVSKRVRMFVLKI